jgi:paraquat-inducible protein B
MSKVANPKLIGAFVLGAIALTIAGIAVIGGGKFFQTRAPLVMFFEGSVAGITVGSPVNFRGVRIGQVTNVFLRYTPGKANPVQIPVFAEISPQNIQIVAPTHGKTEVSAASYARLRSLVEQGLRAQLALPSLVTGQATISLDFYPATAAEFTNLYPDRVEIPTVPSTLQEVQTTLQQIYDKLSQLPLEDLIADTRNLLKGASRLVNDPQVAQAVSNASTAMAELQGAARTLDSRIGPLLGSLQATSSTANQTLQDARQAFGRIDDRGEQLIRETEQTMQTARQALSNAERLLGTTDTLIAPGSSLNYDLTNALREMAAAARSLRDLSEQLQRNPNSLLFGRPADGGSP